MESFTDLDQSEEMIIFKSILTNFVAHLYLPLIKAFFCNPLHFQSTVATYHVIGGQALNKITLFQATLITITVDVDLELFSTMDV